MPGSKLGFAPSKRKRATRTYNIDRVRMSSYEAPPALCGQAVLRSVQSRAFEEKEEQQNARLKTRLRAFEEKESNKDLQHRQGEDVLVRSTSGPVWPGSAQGRPVTVPPVMPARRQQTIMFAASPAQIRQTRVYH